MRRCSSPSTRCCPRCPRCPTTYRRRSPKSPSFRSPACWCCRKASARSCCCYVPAPSRPSASCSIRCCFQCPPTTRCPTRWYRPSTPSFPGIGQIPARPNRKTIRNPTSTVQKCLNPCSSPSTARGSCPRPPALRRRSPSPTNDLVSSAMLLSYPPADNLGVRTGITIRDGPDRPTAGPHGRLAAGLPGASSRTTVSIQFGNFVEYPAKPAAETSCLLRLLDRRRSVGDLVIAGPDMRRALDAGPVRQDCYRVPRSERRGRSVDGIDLGRARRHDAVNER